MTIDTEPLVEPLAHTMCTAAHRMCVCGSHGGMVCVAKKNAARAALAYLLPLIVERCAETAALDVDWTSFGKREIEQWDGGPDAVRDYRLGIAAGRSISTAIRALIPAKGGDHE